MLGTFTFIGNATALVSCGDITLLTDPNFLHRGEYAYLGRGLVSKRLRPPAMQISELPRIDAIVLSHMHGDHWDRRSRAELDGSLPVVTTVHAAKKLRRQGFEAAQGLDTWQAVTIDTVSTRVTITAMPGHHGSRLSRRLNLVPPVMGSMIEFERLPLSDDVLRVYVSGDTLYVDDLVEIPRRFPSIDTGVFHLGGTVLPFGQSPKLGPMVTMDAMQGVRAVRLMDPTQVIPVHFDDYGVFSSPLDDFLREARERGVDDRILSVERGQTVTIGVA